MSDGVNIESLSIEVSSNAQKAKSGIDALASTLEKLKGKVTGGAGLLSFSKKLDTMNETLDRINGRNFAKLEKLINTLKGMKGLSKISFPDTLWKNVEAFNNNVQGMDLTKLKELVRELSALKSVGNVRIPSLRMPTEAAAPTEGPAGTDASETVSVTASAVRGANAELGRTHSLLDGILRKIKGILTHTNETAKSLQKTGDAARETEGRFRKLFSAVKRIVLYRTIRYVLSTITRSLKEGIDHVYQYSKAVNGPFASSMDKLSTLGLYVKNSLGAAFSPLITALTPWVEKMADKFVDFLNLVNQVVAKLSGAKSWTKALKYPKEYAEAADAATEANKKLADSVLGIDELNILSDKSNANGTSANDAIDYTEMFTDVPFDDALDSPMGKFLTGVGKIIGAVWRNAKDLLTVFTAIFVAKTIANGIKRFSTLFTGTYAKMKNWYSGLTGWVGTLTKALLGAAGLVAGFALARTGAYELTNALNGNSGSLAVGIASLIGGVGLAAAGGALIGGPIGALIGAFVGVAGAMNGVVKAWKEEGASSVYDEMGLSTQQLTALTDGLGKEIKEQAKVWDDHKTKIKELQDKYDDLAKTFLENAAQINLTTGSTTEDVDDTIEKLNEMVNTADEGLRTTTNAALESYRQMFLSNDGMITEEEQAVLDAMERKYNDQKDELGSIQERITEIFSNAMTERGYLLKEEMQQIDELAKKMANIGTFEMNLGQIELETVLEDLKSGKIKLSEDQFESFIAEQSEKAKALIEQARSTYASQLAYAEYAFDPNSQEYKTATEAARANYDKVISDASAYMNKVIDALAAQFQGKASLYDAYHTGSSFKDALNTFGWTISGNGDFIKERAATEEAMAALEALEELRQRYNYYAGIWSGASSRTHYTGYATGGFPESGEMFLARENGIPEFVGSIGHRTAVANNEQIVESVAQGVADANAEQNALLREQNELLRALLAKKTDVRIGNRAVSDAVYAQTKANGYRFVKA